MWACHEVHPNEDFPPSAILTGELLAHKTLVRFRSHVRPWLDWARRARSVANTARHSTSSLEVLSQRRKSRCPVEGIKDVDSPTQSGDAGVCKHPQRKLADASFQALL